MKPNTPKGYATAKWASGIKHKMNVGWVEERNPTPPQVTLPLTYPTNNCASLLNKLSLKDFIKVQRNWK